MSAIPDPALVWLVGPAGSGKSTWAEAHFAAHEIVSSDRLRAMAGTGEHDLDASQDAFRALDLLVEARLRRGLMTVVDTLGFDDDRRRRFLAMARQEGLATVAVAFDTPEEVCRERNRARDRTVPAGVLVRQIRRFRRVRELVAGEGWTVIEASGVDGIEPASVPGLLEASAIQARSPASLRFHLHVSRFPDDGGEISNHLVALSRGAEAAGFTGLSVMDHLLQIPQVGREWDSLPECYTTLGFLAAATGHLELGALVTPPTFRSPTLLARIVATLDVLSGGRARCGLGAGWFRREHEAHGLDFPGAGERMDLLEDALQLLPLMWGPGTRAFQGRRIQVPDTICYPRPLRDIPLIVGGPGSRTLRLAARHADGWNLSGRVEILGEKIPELRRLLDREGRDPAAFEISILLPVLCGTDRSDVARRVERWRGRRQAIDFTRGVVTGTAADLIGRFRRLADLGVDAVYVAPVDLDEPSCVDRLAPVVEAFSGR